MADPNAALLTLFTDMLTQLNETRAEAAAARAELQVHIQAQAAAPTAGARATASAAIYDLYNTGQPLDFATRLGSTAYSQMQAPLAVTWDGQTSTFPEFLLELRSHCKQKGMDNILTIAGKNLFTEYQAITIAEIEAARTARTDTREQQNSKALFTCLSQSITGELKTTLFGLEGNLPAHQDGPTLFRNMLDSTLTSSMMVSIQAMIDLNNLDPSEFDYSIIEINKRASHLFTLATTTNRFVPDTERCQIMLTCYNRALQPAEWANWVARKIDDFESNQLTAPTGMQSNHHLMNQAVLKANRLNLDQNRTYKWKNVSLTDDIVAMMAENKYKQPPNKAKTPAKKQEKDDQEPDTSKALPPFVRHYKRPTMEGEAPYVVGDVKQFKGATWNFCDCPNHRDEHKWHIHTAADCKTRQKWLSTNNRGDATAATGTETPAAADASTFDHVAMHATLSNVLSMVAGYEDETLTDCIGQMISNNAQRL